MDRCSAARRRHELCPAVAANHEARVGAQLSIESAACQLLRSGGNDIGDVESTIRTGERDRIGLALVFVIAKQMDLVLLYRTSECRADLLVRVRQNAINEEVLRVKTVVAEVPRQRARIGVGAG